MDKVIMSANQVEKWIDSPEEEMRRIQMTPELALKIKTTRNGHNRPLYPKTAENYTIAMKHGDWEFVGDPIRFAFDGHLIDGQHRIEAIILSGTNQIFSAIKGLPKTAVGKCDIGRKRGVGDTGMLVYGWKQGTLMASILGALCSLCTNRHHQITSSLANKIYQIYKKEVDEVIVHSKSAHLKNLKMSTVLACFAFAAKVSFEKIMQYEEAYLKGENLPRAHPMLLLRDYMLSGRAMDEKKRQNGYKVSIVTLNALMNLLLNRERKTLSDGRFGYEYFANRQMSTIREVKDLFRY